jgi:hypothetical protein
MDANSLTRSLYDYNGLNFALYRQAIRTNTPIKTFSTGINPTVVSKEEIIGAMKSQDNIRLLTQLIISRNSIGLSVDAYSISDKITQVINSWINMGKFDTLNSFISFKYMVDYYNKEFVREFANTILPIDVIKVQSVTNPNGMYAQQSRTLSFKSKPPPFWERALYKRLEDRVREIPMDESQDLFYKFELTGKKIPDAIKLGDIYERKCPEFRME